MGMFESVICSAQKLYGIAKSYSGNARRLHVYPDDTFLVGYPKSGNTWLDFLVACLRADHPEDINFESVETYVADIYCNDSRRLRELPRPRFLKSHERHDSRYPRVVYIVRDPRSVAVSYFHHLAGLGSIAGDMTIDQYIPHFIHGKLDGFGTWEGHVRGWLNAQKQHPDRVLIVKYEDLKSSTELTLSDIALFLGLEVTSEKVQAAIDWSSPENMRKLEVLSRDSGHIGFSGFREGSFFIRKASSSSWKQELGAGLEKQIMDAWGGVMRELDYVHDGV